MYEEEEEETRLNPARMTFPMVPTGSPPGTPLFSGLGDAGLPVYLKPA